ncbi:MAG: M10 family metallopeptidase domain-containing protein [Oligoflexia bacterium]|nr:M10 family metallopeptidase domain-containing protein [Oligoflexia bacterium]
MSLWTVAFALLGLSCSGGGSAGSSGKSLTLVNSAGAAESAAPAVTLALKFVEYTDSAGKPVLSQEALAAMTEKMNGIFAPCGVRLVLEEVQNVEPTNFGLTYSLDSLSSLDRIRAQFDNPKQLVVVNTGEWNHNNVGSANAWTTMPGESPSGAVIEAPVADFAEIVAHELGHYLSLDHVSDQSNLMNPVIYSSSRGLDAGQCEALRQSAQSDRAQALR